MACLRKQPFHVEVFISGSLTQNKPDISAKISALTAQFAVLQVMRTHGIADASVVYICSQDHEAWMHDVSYADGNITYSYPVERAR